MVYPEIKAALTRATEAISTAAEMAEWQQRAYNHLYAFAADLASNEDAPEELRQAATEALAVAYKREHLAHTVYLSLSS